MDSLPALVSVVTAIISLPLLTVCCCLSSLRRRVVVLEENVQLLSDRTGGPAPPQNNFLGGVTFSAGPGPVTYGLAPPAPVPSAPPAYAYFTQMPPLGHQNV